MRQASTRARMSRVKTTVSVGHRCSTTLASALARSYSGRHCEIKASSMAVKQAVSRSFASVAIVALICVAIFIVTMDVLKYGFGVDPTERYARKENDPHYIVRFIYVNPETL